jgi:methionyl-tRNA formyltransferase
VTSNPSRPRAIFFGTPELAATCLRAVLDVAEVVMVVSQPDRPQGRGMHVQPTPVKQLALEHGLRVIQPAKVRTPDFAAELRATGADVGVVVAYGRILPLGVLSAPRVGCVNVHASLLPKLRGAAPIQRAIMTGEARTGVCLMQMDEGMDTGPVLARRELAIGPNETAGELGKRLAELGASVLREELARVCNGELVAVPQDEAGATHAPMLAKDDGRIAWSASAQAVHDLVRGTSPWPGAFSFLDGQRVRLHSTRVLATDNASSSTPGVIVRADAHGIEVACGRGVLAIDELQLDGKRRVTAAQFCAGHPGLSGKSFAERAT